MKKNEMKVLKAVSEETRFGIIKLLMKNPKGVRVSELRKSLKVEATLLSHHLSVIKSAGLVVDTRIGKSVLYNMNTKSKNVEGNSIIAGSYSLKVM